MADKTPRRFDFARDTFAFANELLWAYQTDPATGKMTFRPREPKPQYAHRCFVLTRVVRQFLYHARFDATQKPADDETYHRLIHSIVSKNPRIPSDGIVIPGYSSLREFSVAKEQLLKAECGGAWRSYVLRSHWRMVFPISREHQKQTAAALLSHIKNNFSPIIHLVTFPALTINHGMILFDATETKDGIEFAAYDPNIPAQPSTVTFHRGTNQFTLPANPYWAGGPLNVIEIFRNWIF
ncbi:MAG TPA: hypothetical protein VGN23_02530 [Verrucomicrobiae bacterium]|jgi:hypothetical protein